MIPVFSTVEEKRGMVKRKWGSTGVTRTSQLLTQPPVQYLTRTGGPIKFKPSHQTAMMSCKILAPTVLVLPVLESIVRRLW